jgi:hypothetical protein
MPEERKLTGRTPGEQAIPSATRLHRNPNYRPLQLEVVVDKVLPKPGCSKSVCEILVNGHSSDHGNQCVDRSAASTLGRPSQLRPIILRNHTGR